MTVLRNLKKDLDMNEIKKDLEMSTPQKNVKKLACLGCRDITDELYSLNIDGKIILMCPVCRESLQTILEREDYHDTVSIVQKQFREGIAVYNAGDSSSCVEYGYLDIGRYMKDHQDC